MAAPTLQPFLASRASPPSKATNGEPANGSLYSMQQSRTQARNPLWNRYPAQDKWVFLCLPNTDENWAALCKSLDRPDLAADARFDASKKREQNNTELIALLDDVLKQRSAQEWIDRWTPLGFAATLIQSLKDVAEDPQAWANDYFVKAHCDEVNREVEVRGLPITLSKTPGRVETLGPELGQDTELILADWLGIDWDRIGELKERGVIP